MSRTSGEVIRGWIQTIGQTLALLSAGFWAGYTFIYKEIEAPKSVPINITMDLSLKLPNPAEARNVNATSLFPVRIKVSAKNPSTRQIYILSSAWWMYGQNVKRGETNETEFDESVTRDLTDGKGYYAERYATVTDKPLVAAGSLFFANKSLKPGEEIARILIIYLPHEYDKLRVISKIPTSGKDPTEILRARWKSEEPIFDRKDENGNWQQIAEKEFEDTKREFEVDSFEQISEISLRQ